MLDDVLQRFPLRLDRGCGIRRRRQNHTHAWLGEIYGYQADGQCKCGDDLEIDDGFKRQPPHGLQIIAMSGDTHDERAENDRHDDALDEIQKNVRDDFQVLGFGWKHEADGHT